MEYTVGSSHGVLTVDKDGYVTECQTDNNDSDKVGHLKRITRFDLVEWRRFWNNATQTEIDILDLGYWYNDPKTSAGTYVAPDTDWRKEVADILSLRKRADRVRFAAPELLKILKEAHTRGYFDEHPDDNEIEADFKEEARAAIAKAEGE
jgi:hypothetical protein